MRRNLIAIGSWVGKFLFWFASLLVILWSVAALYFFAAWPEVARALGAACLVSVILTAMLMSRRWWVLGVVALASLLAVRVLYALYPPSNQRDWLEENARAPIVRFEGNLAHVENLRHIFYDADDVRHIRWYNNTYDMRKVEKIDYVVEPFSGIDGIAHTLISFGFSDGQHLAISGEIRREADESFSFEKAFFRHYELYFAAGDERDHIGLRANRGSNPVYLIPIKTTEENAYAILRSMLEMLTRVATQPEYYNAVTNSCTSNIICHIESNTDIDIPDIDSRRLIPALSWEIAYDVGIVDVDCAKDEVLAECLINGHAQFLPEELSDPLGIAWSRKIRQKPVVD